MLTAEFASELIDVVADELTNVEAHRFQRRNYAEAIFHKLARRDPEAAMEAIGRWVIDEKRGFLFRITQFRGLFDSIGLDTVRPWVERHGALAAIGVARHLNGPRVDNDGSLIVPALADWLLTKFESEDRVLAEFCMGRHSGEVRWGHARDRREEIEKAVKPFLSDDRRWVREWAKYEIDELLREIDYDEQYEDEIGRM